MVRILKRSLENSLEDALPYEDEDESELVDLDDSSDRWVVWQFCPQEGAGEIPVPKWSYQGDAPVSQIWKNPLNFEHSFT